MGGTGGPGGLATLLLGLLAALAPAQATGEMEEGFLDSEEFYVSIIEINLNSSVMSRKAITSSHFDSKKTCCSINHFSECCQPCG